MVVYGVCVYIWYFSSSNYPRASCHQTVRESSDGILVYTQFYVIIYSYLHLQ